MSFACISRRAVMVLAALLMALAAAPARHAVSEGTARRGALYSSPVTSIVLDDFDSAELQGWDTEPHSKVERTTEDKRSGAGALKWTFLSDAQTRYGNSITKTFPPRDLSAYEQIAFWFLSRQALQGRVGCQLVTPNGIVGLADVHDAAKQGTWTEIRLDLSGHNVDEVTGLRLFCDGLAWQAGEHTFLLDDLRAEHFPEATPPERRDYGEPLGPAFSKLPSRRQARLRDLAEPPPLAKRRNPYSTPMYYLMHKGYKYEGDLDRKERVYPDRAPKGEAGPDYGQWALERNRPDWQEAMVRDWAELGLTSTHLNVYPPDEGMALDADERNALIDFRRLSAKYGLKIGIRMDFPLAMHPESGTPAWRVHPRNPNGELQSYLGWVREIATIFRGAARYYVIGDEYNFHEKTPAEGGWDPALYVQVWSQVADAIRAVDAEAKLSMFGASSGNWPDALALLGEREYRRRASAVAINYPSYLGVEKFVADLDQRAPGMTLLSNGVGYCSSKDAEPRYPEYDPYNRYSDADQAAAVAKNMLVWWELDAGAAPYYITLRNWVLHGRTYPRWFGFFGFEDYVVDDRDALTVKRYPAWHALRTITHTFHDRPSFARPDFALFPIEPVSHTAAFVRGNRELVLILWQDTRRTVYTDVRLDSSRFKYAVQVNLLNYQEWSDAVYTVGPNGNVTLRDVRVGFEPVILRLFAE